MNLRAGTRERARSNWRLLLLIILLAAGSLKAYGIGEPVRVHFTAQPSTLSFELVGAGGAVPIYVDKEDWQGVRRAVVSFAGDSSSVTGHRPQIGSMLTPHDADVVMVGTLGKSALIDGLIAAGRIDVEAIRGHWESSVTQVVEHPAPGARQALVIAGAYKRGTIFALYGLSEQMGVSPWYWWADVAIRHHESVFMSAARYVAPEPRVRYRGTFLNDEAPSLTGWATEKFGGLNHNFYEHVFELLLRLRANYLWPAMWNSAFNEDDAADPQLADE